MTQKAYTFRIYSNLKYKPGTRWGKGSYPSAESLSVYSTAPADWTIS